MMLSSGPPCTMSAPSVETSAGTASGGRFYRNPPESCKNATTVALKECCRRPRHQPGDTEYYRSLRQSIHSLVQTLRVAHLACSLHLPAAKLKYSVMQWQKITQVGKLRFALNTRNTAWSRS